MLYCVCLFSFESVFRHVSTFQQLPFLHTTSFSTPLQSLPLPLSVKLSTPRRSFPLLYNLSSLEKNGVILRSGSMDSGSRFLSTIAPSGVVDAGDELNEDEILWTDDDFNAGQQLHPPPTKQQHRRSVSFHHTNTGILAALPEINSRIPVLYRKPSISSPVKAVPRERDNSGDYLSTQSMPATRKLRQSAPMKVPIMSIAISKQRNSRLKEEYEYSNGGGAGDDEMMMLPPHEIVARGCCQSSGSMMEGAGRTLKGRDLRQVRNAVFRQTGFLD